MKHIPKLNLHNPSSAAVIKCLRELSLLFQWDCYQKKVKN